MCVCVCNIYNKFFLFFLKKMCYLNFCTSWLWAAIRANEKLIRVSNLRLPGRLQPRMAVMCPNTKSQTYLEHHEGFLVFVITCCNVRLFFFQCCTEKPKGETARPVSLNCFSRAKANIKVAR